MCLNAQHKYGIYMYRQFSNILRKQINQFYPPLTLLLWQSSGGSLDMTIIIKFSEISNIKLQPSIVHVVMLQNLLRISYSQYSTELLKKFSDSVSTVRNSLFFADNLEMQSFSSVGVLTRPRYHFSLKVCFNSCCYSLSTITFLQSSCEILSMLFV